MKSLFVLFAVATLGCENTLAGLETDAKEALTVTRREAAEVRRDLATAHYSARSEVDEFVAKANTELAGLSQKVERLEADAEHAPAEARQAMNEQIRALEVRRDELQRKTESLSSKASREWDETKRDISTSMDALKRDIDAALERMAQAVRRTAD